jgi:uncharacterized protein (TIGR02118 family)
MHKLVVLLRGAADSERIERRWSDEFVPLAERMPGLRRVIVGRGAGAPNGRTDVLLVHEFVFDDREALYAALTSPEGQTAGAVLLGFAGAGAEIFFAEHHEMSLGEPGEPDG